MALDLFICYVNGGFVKKVIVIFLVLFVLGCSDLKNLGEVGHGDLSGSIINHGDDHPYLAGGSDSGGGNLTYMSPEQVKDLILSEVQNFETTIYRFRAAAHFSLRAEQDDVKAFFQLGIGDPKTDLTLEELSYLKEIYFKAIDENWKEQRYQNQVAERLLKENKVSNEYFQDRFFVHNSIKTKSFLDQIALAKNLNDLKSVFQNEVGYALGTYGTHPTYEGVSLAKYVDIYAPLNRLYSMLFGSSRLRGGLIEQKFNDGTFIIDEQSPCYDLNQELKVASVSGFNVSSDVCISAFELSKIPVNSLVMTIRSLLVHEFSHLYGFNETVAHLLQDFMIDVNVGTTSEQNRLSALNIHSRLRDQLKDIYSVIRYMAFLVKQKKTSLEESEYEYFELLSEVIHERKDKLSKLFDPFMDLNNWSDEEEKNSFYEFPISSRFFYGSIDSEIPLAQEMLLFKFYYIPLSDPEVINRVLSSEYADEMVFHMHTQYIEILSRIESLTTLYRYGFMPVNPLVLRQRAELELPTFRDLSDICRFDYVSVDSINVTKYNGRVVLDGLHIDVSQCD